MARIAGCSMGRGPGEGKSLGAGGGAAILAVLLFAAAAGAAEPGTRGIAMTRVPVPYKGSEIYSNSIALVVGVNRYEKAPPLQYAVSDARSVAAALAKQGFPETNVILLTDAQATREAIRHVLEWTIPSAASKNDRLLFFFAGHGATSALPGGGEEGWLLPADADPANLIGTAISMSDLKSTFRRLPPKHTMLVVDACYGGYTLFRAAGPEKFDPAYFELLTRERVVRVLTAGAKDERVVEEAGSGLLTQSFLKGIAGLADTNGDLLITASELYNWLDPIVYRDSDHLQRPQFGSLDGAGEFVFVRPEPPPMPAPVAAAPAPTPALVAALSPSAPAPSPVAAAALLVPIPAGSFLMGRSGGEPDEGPAHPVSVGGFSIGAREVSNAEYTRFVAASGVPAPSTWKGGAPPKGEEDSPVRGVSWREASGYAAWAGARLPTEAEWERAAKLAREGKAKLAGVGEDAWEWTSDWYAPYPGSAAAKGSGEKCKVMRGGARVFGGGATVPEDRFRADPESKLPQAGIRLAGSGK